MLHIDIQYRLKDNCPFTCINCIEFQQCNINSNNCNYVHKTCEKTVTKIIFIKTSITFEQPLPVRQLRIAPNFNPKYHRTIIN